MMVRLLVGLLVLGSAAMAYAFDACTAYNPSDGIVCTMTDGATQGVCNNNVCIRNYTIPGNAARTGTGTITSSGSTVTGSGTVFTTELHVGDDITAGGQRLTVANISSDTSLVVVKAFAPAISAGSSFTYTNPIVRWLDASGNTIAVLNSLGALAIGQAYTVGALSVTGATSTAAGADAASAVIVTAGNGGGTSPITGNGGFGADVIFTAGGGGTSDFPASFGGGGGQLTYTAGAGGLGSAGANGGNGGNAFWKAGPAGGTTSSGRLGGSGGTSYVLGGAGGNAAAGSTNGDGGSVIVSGGVAGSGVGAAGGVGDVIVGLNGGITKIGTSAQTQINNTTGDLTKIKNVPVAGMWNVNAFQQANAGGM